MSNTIRLNVVTMVATTSSDPSSRISWDSLPDELSTVRYIGGQGVYLKYASLNSQYKNKIVESVKLYFMAKDGTYIYQSGFDPWQLYSSIHVFDVENEWNENTISYVNHPTADTYYYYVSLSSAGTSSFAYVYNEIIDFSSYTKKSWLRNLLDYGVKIEGNYNISKGYVSQYPLIKHKGSSNVPYIEITFSDNSSSLNVSSCSPTSGFRAKYTANTYNWSTTITGFSITNPTVSHSYFRYRANASSQYTEIDCGSALSYTMPANTISTDSFQWQVSIVDSNGHTSTSDWFTINTQEATSTATIVSPKNITIDGSDINRFEWLHNISTGTAQTKADLQYSSDSGSTWTQFATAIGSATYSNIAADTFNAGTYLWRVRTYNTDNVAGSWSEVKPFTVIAKPHVYAVTSEQNPKPKVSWQGEGQQAFRVYIDNVFDSGVVFGTADNYTLPIYLDDGTYTVNVIVQNNYGLWSNPGTAPINVTNTPGTSMVLVPVYEGDGLKLTWTEVLSYAYYVVYRDNVPIAKIRTNEFKDYTALGQHSYFIRGIYASSKFYGLSNVLETNTAIEQLMITDLESEISLSIEQNDSSFAELSITDSVNNTSVYISAADYPINEVSHFKNKSIRFDCAFVKNNESALSFRNMLGKLVCVKTPSGTSIVGNLLAQNRVENYFYEKYSCTLVQTHYEEEIHL